MPEEGTFCTNGEVIRKATSWASTTSIVEDYTNQFIKEEEGVIMLVAGIDYKTDYSKLTDRLKEFLRQTASDGAAISVIHEDLNNFPSRVIAEDAINVLRDRYLRNLGILRDEKVQDNSKDD